jgi:hypothetical protein
LSTFAKLVFDFNKLLLAKFSLTRVDGQGDGGGYAGGGTVAVVLGKKMTSHIF